MYEYAIKEIVKIIDGDTIDIIIDLGFSLTKKERVRLAGIDTPECRTRDLEEKTFGLEAKEYLAMRLNASKNLIVKTEKDGKYGRMLGWIHDEDRCINNDMILLGYAWAYDGGSKQKSLQSLIDIRKSNNG
jgi:micrococcal nuclease